MKRYLPFIISVLLVISLIMSGCSLFSGGSGNTPGTSPQPSNTSTAITGSTPWQSDRPIKEALNATASSQNISLGDLTANQARVAVPSGLFRLVQL